MHTNFADGNLQVYDLTKQKRREVTPLLQECLEEQ